MVDLLIGGYTSPGLDGRAAGISAARFVEGALVDVRPLIPTSDPSYLTVSSAGQIYAVDESGNRVVAFDAAGRPLGAADTAGDTPCHVALSPDERFVLVADYGSGSVSVHERLADGSLGAGTAYVEHGPGAHAHMVAVDPASGTAPVVLVPDLGLDAVVAYRLDNEGGLHELFRLSLPEGTGPRHVAFGDAHLYVLGELGSTVTTFVRTETGWDRVDAVSTIPSDWTARNQAAAIKRDGDRLFVTNRGHDSVAMFALDPLPRLVDRVPCGGREPRDLLVTPDGEHVLVANQHTDGVAVFAVGTDGLQLLSSAATPSPVCLIVR